MSDQEIKEKKESNVFKVLTVILALLVIVLGFLLFRSQETNQKIETMEADNVVLQQELDSVLQEYERIKLEYGDLNEKLSTKDSAIMAQAQEIQKLIASQGDYRTIKKKLELLQNQGKEYVRMLDSLYVVNQQLTTENKTIKEQVVKLTTEKETLSQEKETLTQKVNTAAKVRAHGFSIKGYMIKGLSKKEAQTDKARKIKVFTVTFMLGANELAEAGDLDLYCRIALPDGRILALGTGDAYSFVNAGQRLQYTIKKTVNYTQSEQNVTMSWNLREGDEAVAGVYNAQIFTSTDYLGQANIILK